ncbi:MAG: FAD-binding protein [Dehalococcoidales bacterium]|nr:FAD-binding protein [Dehalococcoidales bacterium]
MGINISALSSLSEFTCDVLIIGSGGAGLRAAIEARKMGVDVLVVGKSPAGRGNNTTIAGGGFAATFTAAEDNCKVHLDDTLAAGGNLNNRVIADTVVRGAGQQVSDLESFGVRIVKKSGQVLTSPVPGHSHPRVVLCEERLGAGFTLPMSSYATKIGVRFTDNILITQLLVSDGAAFGAAGVSKDGEPVVFLAKTVILCSGGLGQIYRNTDNTPATTGDGYALALAAGLPLLDMEFVQFYPTGIGMHGNRLILYETFVFRAGARIRDAAGEDVLVKYFNSPNEMTRDRISRALMQEISQGKGIDGKLYIDLPQIPPEVMTKFARLLPKGVPPNERCFICPTTHFTMGGVVIDGSGRTEIERLFAAGEVCGGMHGSNRLGGNAITEILVMGTLAGRNAAEAALNLKISKPQKQVRGALDELHSQAARSGSITSKELRKVLKDTLWQKAGIIRDAQTLAQAIDEIKILSRESQQIGISSSHDLWQAFELANMLSVSEVVCQAALERTESRGAHYRSDFPHQDDARWLQNIIVRRSGDNLELTGRAVVS